MKRKKPVIWFVLLSFLLLTACSKEVEKDYSQYINEINPIFMQMTEIDSKIACINTEDENSFTDLLTLCDELTGLYNKLSLVEAPEEFLRTQSLAKEGEDYMKQACDYFSSAFDNNEVNETKLENGMECYNRANKRLHYIIKIIHSEPITE